MGKLRKATGKLLNNGKIMGQPIGQPWESSKPYLPGSMLIYWRVPSGKCSHKTMETCTIFDGKTRCFNGHLQQRGGITRGKNQQCAIVPDYWGDTNLSFVNCEICEHEVFDRGMEWGIICSSKPWVAVLCSTMELFRATKNAGNSTPAKG